MVIELNLQPLSPPWGRWRPGDWKVQPLKQMVGYPGSQPPILQEGPKFTLFMLKKTDIFTILT